MRPLSPEEGFISRGNGAPPSPTAASALASMRDRIPSMLVSTSCYERAMKLGELLPLHLTLAAGFEIRLDGPGADADFAVQLCRAARSTSPECSRGGVNLSGGNRCEREWPRITRFLEEWRSPANTLSEIFRVYLEFDTSQHPQGQAAPSLLFSVRQDRKRQPAAMAQVARVCALLNDGGLPRGIPERLKQMASCGTHRLAIADVGFMFPRKADWVRVCMAPWGTPGLVGCLPAIGWPYAWKGLEELEAELYGSGIDHVHLALDLGESFRSRLGFECYLPGCPPWEKDRPASFLRFLVGLGLCTAEKREALLAMIGKDLPRHIPHLKARCMLRAISHFKIVLEDGEIKFGKAYLYAYALNSGVPGPLGPQSLRSDA